MQIKDRIDEFILFKNLSDSAFEKEIGLSNGLWRKAKSISEEVLIKVIEHFPEIDEAVKYDIFFERIFQGISINGIPAEDICINLNGLKRTNERKKYVITTIPESRFTLIDSFEMQFRPIEKNLIMNCKGNDIFMYQVSSAHEEVLLNAKGDHSLQRAIYEIYNSGWMSGFKYAANDFSIALKHFITRK